jgi:hypothetical protein
MTVPEVVHTSSSIEPVRSSALERQLAAERSMVRAIIRGVFFATPVCVAVLIGMMALALDGKQPWYVWTGLGALMGVYVAVFFGMLAGVMRSSHSLDVADEAAAHVQEGSTAHPAAPHPANGSDQERGTY